MARNRQRARERKQRLHRENVPGELDTSSAEVEEAEAAIVAGAAGEPYEDGDERLEAEALDSAPPGDGGDDDRPPRDGAGEPEPAGEPSAITTPGAPTKGRPGPRLVHFLRACWAELQRVQWPNRNQVGQGTAVVLGFVVIAGAFLGFADLVAEEIVDIII